MMRSFFIVLPLLLAFGCDHVAACKEGDAQACADACDNGEAGEGGCLSAVMAYSKGDGVDRNQRKAASLATKGCELGNNRSCFLAYLAYKEGRGVPMDKEKAVQFLVGNCTKDNTKNCFMASEALMVAEDYDQALAMKKIGCAGGEEYECKLVESHARSVHKMTHGDSVPFVDPNHPDTPWGREF